jgi:hypothetical protein
VSGAPTIVLSSYDMDEVEQLCDRVGIIGGRNSGNPSMLPSSDDPPGKKPPGRKPRRRGGVAVRSAKR